MFPSIYSYGALSAVARREPPLPRPPRRDAPLPPPPAASILKRGSDPCEPPLAHQERCHVRFSESGRARVAMEDVRIVPESRALVPGGRKRQPCIGAARSAASQNG